MKRLETRFHTAADRVALGDASNRRQGRFRDVQEFVRLSREVMDLDELHSLVGETTSEFGIRYFVLSHHVNALGPNVVQLSNYPEGWSNKMRTHSYLAVDPVIRACQKTAASFLWSELDRLITLSPLQRSILEGAGRSGIGEGFTVPIHIPGECTGSGSFAVGTGDELKSDAMPALHYLACFAFEAARRLAFRADHLNQTDSGLANLTPRQLDCVVLIAQGKSDWATGKILGISERTVQEHLDQARKRYGVGSRMQLVVRALFDNQLGFEDIIRV
jgi:LuxR family quorum-sensing system transcriptional regulator CciR